MADFPHMKDDDVIGNDHQGAPSPSLSRSMHGILIGVGLFFFAIFLMSAIFQYNDQGIMVWLIFYYALAVLALVGVALHCGLFVSNREFIKKGLYGACLALLVYSVVLTIISALAVAKADPEDKGEDAENFNDKEEKGFELGGAMLGMVSVAFNVYSFHKAN
jgi:Transmembrane family 220, helix